MYNICSAIDHVKDDGTVPDYLKFDLYMFRVGIQIMVRNMGYAIEDIKSALFYKDDDEAKYLLIDCYIKMEAFDKAKAIIEKSKKKAVELQEYEKIKLYEKKEEEIQTAKEEFNEKLQKLQIFKDMENDQKLRLYNELSRKGIKLKQQIHNIPANYQANIYTDDLGKYHFPILIIYEEFNMTDYIQDVEENTMISDIFDIIFKEKLPWDKENKYNPNVCTAFFEMSDYDPILKSERNYYYPLRNDNKLIDILTNKRIYMNGFPVLVIVSQLSKFYAHFLKNKIILKRKYISNNDIN
jgi:hypothetical protein